MHKQGEWKPVIRHSKACLNKLAKKTLTDPNKPVTGI